VRDSAQKFIEHKIDMSHMVLSASLNKDIGKLVELKRKGQMPKGLGAHYRLAMAAYERDPDGAPQIGQRLSYIVINGPKGAKMSDRVMNPMEALERNVSPDYRYYLEHKFVKSVERLMIPIIGKDKTAQLFKGHNSRVSIKETPSTTSKTSIMGFVKKLPTCVVCKAGISRKPLRSDYGVEIGGDAVPCDSQGRALRFSIEMNKVAVHPELARPAPNLCDHCREKHYPDVQQKLENRCKSLDREIKKMKAKCVKCQGDRYGVMECSTDDCAIFYRRIGARRELLQAKIDLRNLDW
jgi:DNA polymerase delta subunit 1